MWRLSILILGLAAGAAGAATKFDVGVSKAERRTVEDQLAYAPEFKVPGAKAMIAKVELNDDGRPDFVVKIGNPRTCAAQACKTRLLVSRRISFSEKPSFQMTELPGSVKDIDVLPAAPKDVEGVHDIRIDGKTFTYSGKSFYQR